MGRNSGIQDSVVCNRKFVEFSVKEKREKGRKRDVSSGVISSRSSSQGIIFIHETSVNREILTQLIDYIKTYILYIKNIL